MKPKERTESLDLNQGQRQAHDWVLILAMDSQALSAWPQSFSLAGARSVSIGRGQERRLTSNGLDLRLDLPDRWISENHARLVASETRWSLEDSGSRNGTRVNGERLDRKALDDGDILELGGTFLVLRRSDGLNPDPIPLAERPEALRTLSPRFGHEISVLRRVMRSSVPILILGETGTGKEGIAQEIHEQSGREGPLVAVNCGAIPATIIESELFGSRRGAFSGAEERVGLLRTAHRGTLFLDEVAELPTASQAALLRVLQTKEVTPLGETRATPVDLRIIAATNRPIAAFVEQEKLRRDLYARLSGYELRLPPLHERLEDMGLLVSTLIARHDRRGAARTLSSSAAWSLFAYPWPLNVRELEQCLSAAVNIALGEIGVMHLPSAVRAAAARPKVNVSTQRDRLLNFVKKYRGNLTAVARKLGTSRSQLYRLLVRHSITRADLNDPHSPPAP